MQGSRFWTRKRNTLLSTLSNV